MKKIWMRLTAVLACLALIGAGASIRAFAVDKDPETGLTIYSTQPALHYITENGAHTITDYYGGNTRKIIVIPNDVAGNPFSKIRSGAFEGIQADTVFVPDTMMEIATGAFDPGTHIKVYAAGDYRGFEQPTKYQRDENGRRYLPDPDTSMLTVKSDTPYYSTVTVNGVSYRQEGISATVTGYSGTETELKIAPSVNGLPVTTVESGALKDAALTKLYLPKSVTRVEEGALGEFEVVFMADTGSGVSTEEDPICEHTFEGGVCTVCGYRLYFVGDTDGNEVVDSDDAVYLLFSIFFLDDYPISQPADFNGDGTVDSDDAIHLLFYVFFPDDYPLAY